MHDVDKVRTLTMRQRPQNPNIDDTWFKQQLAMRKLSVRGLAKSLDISPSAASLMLRGISKVPDHLVARLAEQLLVDPAEIYRRLGMPTRHIEPTVTVSHYLAENREICPLAPEARFEVASPAGISKDGFAIQVRAMGLYEHWMLFATGVKCSPDQVLNRLCLYMNTDNKQYVAIIRAGYLPGTFDAVSAFNDGTVVKDVHIEWAMTIAWIKPAVI